MFCEHGRGEEKITEALKAIILEVSGLLKNMQNMFRPPHWSNGKWFESDSIYIT